MQTSVFQIRTPDFFCSKLVFSGYFFRTFWHNKIKTQTNFLVIYFVYNQGQSVHDAASLKYMDDNYHGRVPWTVVTNIKMGKVY